MMLRRSTLAIAKLKAFLGGFINDENGYYDVYSNNDWSNQMQEQSHTLEQEFPRDE